MRSYLPLLRAVAIVADVVLLLVVALFFRSKGVPKDLDDVLFVASIVIAASASLAVLVMVKPDPEERQLEADVRKAELRKRLRDLDSTNQRSQ
jgi:hypothetical protein